jgi:hypothetical protein
MLNDRLERVFPFYGIDENERRAMITTLCGPMTDDQYAKARKDSTLTMLMADAVLRTRPLEVTVTDLPIHDAIVACGFNDWTFSKRGEPLPPFALNETRSTAPGRKFRARLVGNCGHGQDLIRVSLQNVGKLAANAIEMFSFLMAYPGFPVCTTALATTESSNPVPRVFVAHHDDVSQLLRLSLHQPHNCSTPWVRHLVVEYD